MIILGKLVEIFLLGLIGGAVPGPILTAVFAEVLRGGFWKCLKIILWVLIIDSIVAISVLVFFLSLSMSQFYFQMISIGGSAVLLWLAWQVWKVNQLKSDDGGIFTFYKIFILTILNGSYWIFWITICVPRAIELSQYLRGSQIIFLLFFELGWIIATVSLAFIFSKFRPFLERKNLIAATFKVFALILVFFALKSIVSTAIYFFK